VVISHPDPQLALEVFSAQSRQSGLQRMRYLARDRKQLFARLGQSDPAAMSAEERFADDLFKLPDLKARCRLGAMDPQCAASDAARLRYGEKGAQMIAVELGHGI
jgi:hypothetical protein